MRDPTQPDTRYVDELIGPDTITTMPPATIAAVVHHGTLGRTVDRDVSGARDVLDRLARLGIDLDAVSATLETEGVNSFIQAHTAFSGVLAAKADALIGPEVEGASLQSPPLNQVRPRAAVMENWVNPTCSKCAAALEALDKEGIDVEQRRYLEQAPTAAELHDVLRRLRLEPWDITRLTEATAGELSLDPPLMFCL